MQKVEWNTVQEECGALCVTTPGMPWMLSSCVDNWDIQLLV